jgi:hypothetical protein
MGTRDGEDGKIGNKMILTLKVKSQDDVVRANEYLDTSGIPKGDDVKKLRVRWLIRRVGLVETITIMTRFVSLCVL